MTKLSATDFRLLMSASAAHVVGIVMSILSPFIIGALSRSVDDGGFGVPEGTSGTLITVELLAIAAAAYLVIPWLNKASLRKLAFLGVSICLLANMYSLFVVPGQVVLMGISRIVSGLGAGIVYSVGSAAASRTHDPDKIFAFIVVIGAVVSSAGLLLIPMATAGFGYRGGFTFIVLNILVVAPFLALLPSSVKTRAAVEKSDRRTAPPPWTADRKAVVVLVIAMLILNVGDGAIFYFSEGIGHSIGMSSEQVGFALTVASVAGLMGGLVAASLNTRYGRTLPLTIALVVRAGASIAIVSQPAPASYWVLQCLLGFTVYFVIPYIFGLCALVDRAGRVAAMAGGTVLIGSGISASLGGHIIENFSYFHLGLFATLVVIVNLIILIPVSLKYDRAQHSVKLANLGT